MRSTQHGVVGSALFDLPRRWLLVLTVAAAAAGAVAAYSFTAAKHYKATAVLVVAPVSPSDPTFIGIDVLRDTERRSAAETAARLIRTPEIAQTVRLRLGLRSSTGSLLDDISTDVVDRSDAVAVAATTTDRARAAQLANAFVDAFLAARTATFQSEVVSAVARLQQRLASIPPNQRLSPAGARLQRRLADTRALVATRDPTVSAGSQATQPTSAAWPKPVRWTIFAALAGLALGLLLALAIGLVNAVRRPESLRPEEYDQGVSERIVGRLERRLTERIDALAAEQKRLAARESALEVREREVAEKLKELRTAASEARPGPAPESDELRTREEALERRVRAVEQREQDLARRAAELVREQSEFAEQQETLAQREQVAAERLEDTGTRAELDERERKLGERETSLEERERELARRAEALDVQEEDEAERTRAEAARQADELEARAAELASRTAELSAREAELESRQEALAREVAELTGRAAAVDAQAIEVAERETRLSETQEFAARREEELAAREAELAVAEHPLLTPRLAAPPPIEPIVSPASSTQGLATGWRLDELERLVDAQADAFPHRIDEWRSYLYYLRDYADASGRVPDQFDWLIEDTFSELLARR